LNVSDDGVGAGVAMSSADGGPLLGGDGVDARTRRWSGPIGGVDADGKRGSEDARVVGVKAGLGCCNNA